MTILVGIWGPYHYGAFWSVFFVIWLGLWIERSRIPGSVLTACFFFISLSMFNGFSAMNTVYKLHHYYPYDPRSISRYFEGQKGFFDADQKPKFFGDELKWYAQAYWLASKQDPPVASLSSVPLELYWLILELEPQKNHTRYELDSKNMFIPALIFNFH
jgi:hypothetical protein